MQKSGHYNTFANHELATMMSDEFQKLVIFEDSDYVILNKPAGISTLADRNDLHNILSLARENDQNLKVCHRLDKETSGVLVLARNPEAFRLMAIQFEKRTVNKIYRAVVDGVHDFQDQVIDLPLLPGRSGTTRIDRRRGKESQTTVSTLEKYHLHSLVECKPTTGRMHQIRAHLSFIGAPVSGDENYGGRPVYLSTLKRNYRPKKDLAERPLIRRPPLHAFQINFQNRSGQRVTFEAPYPKDFSILLNQLSKHHR